MARSADAFKKTGPAIAPGEDDNDTGAAARQTVRIVPASGMPPPQTSAPASIFAAGEAARPKPEPRPYRTLNVAAVVIKTDVPLPPAAKGITPVYRQLWDKMPVGSMVELPKRQASGLAAHCKKAGAKYAVRTLSVETKGIWRLA